jgi:hypothetical protein
VKDYANLKKLSEQKVTFEGLFALEHDVSWLKMYERAKVGSVVWNSVDD